MKTSLSISILLATFLIITGCVKENCGCEPQKNPPVFFQYEYINHAWGYRHHGFLIDADGQVKGFREPKNWVFPDSTGLLRKADLEYNITLCDTVFTKVDRKILESNYDKIEDIRNGKIVDNGMVMADAGTGVLSAWYWSQKAGKYESVFLISNGDLSKENSHPDVKALVDWLKTVGAKTDRFYWYDGK